MTVTGPEFSAADMAASWAEFSPGALARMTGFSQDLQRVWRRRGQIAPLDGSRARYSSVEVAELFVRHQLSLWGVSPENTSKIGARAGRTALYFALLNVEGACEVCGDDAEVARFLEAFDCDDWLAQELSGSSQTARYLWRGDCGVSTFEADIQKVFGRERSVSICCIDLAALGTRLGNLAERPILSVTLQKQPNARMVRKLTSAQRDDLA